MNKHTPTPWSQHGNDLLGSSGDWINFEFKPEDAALIVRAVNCHEELVAALRAIELQADANSGGFRSKAQLEDFIRAVRDQARAALDKAAADA